MCIMNIIDIKRNVINGNYRNFVETFQLVGHVIKGGGIAISGQEQRQLGGGFLEGEGSPPGE